MISLIACQTNYSMHVDVFYIGIKAMKIVLRCLWRLKIYFQTNRQTSLMKDAIWPSRPGLVEQMCTSDNNVQCTHVIVHKWRQGPLRFPCPNSSQFLSPLALISNDTYFFQTINICLLINMFKSSFSNFSSSGTCCVLTPSVENIPLAYY